MFWQSVAAKPRPLFDDVRRELDSYSLLSTAIFPLGSNTMQRVVVTSLDTRLPERLTDVALADGVTAKRRLVQTSSDRQLNGRSFHQSGQPRRSHGELSNDPMQRHQQRGRAKPAPPRRLSRERPAEVRSDDDRHHSPFTEDAPAGHPHCGQSKDKQPRPPDHIPATTSGARRPKDRGCRHPAPV